MNPDVFSSKDYDTLQAAESFRRASLIASYEPQKVDAKVAENNIASNNDTFSK